MYKQYNYKALEAAALAPNAPQTAIDELGEWFEQYGMDFWNGEYFEIDRGHRLFRVYKEVDEDEFEVTGYEIR